MTRTIDYEALEETYGDTPSHGPMRKNTESATSDGHAFQKRAEVNRNGAHKRLRRIKERAL
jgi:hypothetical protein